MKTIDEWYEYFGDVHNNPSPYELLEAYEVVLNTLKKYMIDVERDVNKKYTPKELSLYLAARYARHPEMKKYAKVLEDYGHTVTSRWIEGNHKIQDNLTGWDLQRENARLADEDVLDIIASDYFLCFNDEDESKPIAYPSLGGRHVEFGIAVTSRYLRRDSMAIHVGLIGKRTHIFHWLPFVEVYPTFDVWLEDHRRV
jgi:hypothetical protein